MRKLIFLVLLISPTLLISQTGLVWAAESSAPTSDVRVLIDISGSMKKNDPENLRVPAVRMMTNLMPKDAESGVWTFAKYVNMLVPLGQVDEKWQQQAYDNASKINSVGLFTNIGDAIEKSTYDWYQPSDSEKRSLILLTDGVVDVSKDAVANIAARNKILNEHIPKLARGGVAVHTIALSQDADHELLKALSEKTDGIYSAVNSADDMQRVFLQIFEQSTERESLPLVDNRFKVDSAIEEMTVLIFRAKDSEPATLITPGEKQISAQATDEKVRWFKESSYDLVTIQNPEVGEWGINAEIDPDNRVMVVSNLELRINDIPGNAMVNADIPIELQLLEDGEVIDKPDFIKLVKATLQVSRDGEQQQEIPLSYDSQSSKFKAEFTTEQQGILELTITVVSPTFERVRRASIKVLSTPVTAELIATPEHSLHQIILQPNAALVDVDSLKAMAEVEYPDGRKRFVTGVKNEHGQMLLQVESEEVGDYQIVIDIKAKSTDGTRLRQQLKPIKFTQPSKEELESLPPVQSQPQEPEAQEAETVSEEPPVEEESVSPPEEQVDEQPPEEESEQPASIEVKQEEVLSGEPEDPVEEESNWGLWLGIGLGINILVIGLGLFAWRFIKKKNEASSDAMADALGLDDGE